MNAHRLNRPARFSGRVLPPAEAGGPVRRSRRRRRRRRPPRRSGIIFIIALATITILTALLLVYAQEMRTEQLAAANRVADAQADAVEQGAEQWVMAQVETYTTPLSGNTGTANVGFGQVDLTTIPAAGLQVGGGYFWLLSPNPTDDQTYGYGIVDEASKLNLNRAIGTNPNNTDPNFLVDAINLPNMTQEAVDCIGDWVDTGESPNGTDGAESNYYQGLGGDSYSCKNNPFNTVDELLLVKGVTPTLLFGQDLNRDGVIDAHEAALGGGAGTPGGAAAAAITVNSTLTDRRGFVNYVTCYSTNNPPNTGGPSSGLVNINTAPEAVLMCLPGLTQSDADAMISERTQSSITGASNDTTWARTALGTAKYNVLFPTNPIEPRYGTGKSYQYSADIVAVSGDGRAFRRVRLVVDARTQPAKIVYRKDVTDLGWSLPPDVRTSLRAGQGLPADAGVTSGTGVTSNNTGIP